MTPTAAVAPINSLWLQTPKTRRHTAKPTSPRQRRVRTQLHAPPISRRDRPDTRGSVRYPGQMLGGAPHERGKIVLKVAD